MRVVTNQHIFRGRRTDFNITAILHKVNPVDIEQVEYHLYLRQNIIKGETETLRHLALETMNTRYSQDKWLHIFTDGSQIEGCINAGAGIHCELFSCYIPQAKHSTTFDGEIEAIRTTLCLLNLHQI